MAEKRKFAAVAVASSGRQVLVYVEPDGDGMVIHQVAEFDGGQVDMKIEVKKSTPELDEATYHAIDTFDTERADRILAQMDKHLNGLMEAGNG